MTPTEKLAKELMCIYWNDSEKEIPPTEHALRLAKQVQFASRWHTTEHALRLAKHVQRMVLDARIEETESWRDSDTRYVPDRLEELRSERNQI